MSGVKGRQFLPKGWWMLYEFHRTQIAWDRCHTHSTVPKSLGLGVIRIPPYPNRYRLTLLEFRVGDRS